MKHVSKRILGGVAALGLLAGLVLAVPASAQTVSGEAYGAYVSTPTASLSKSPLATLPSVSPGDGAMANAEADAVSASGALQSNLLTSVATGAAGAGKVSSQSVATVADVSILSGLITAEHVVGVASSYVSGSTGASDASGSTFEDLRVNGVAVTFGDGTVAPNTRINLPGVGYVVLNEQARTGNGFSSSGMTVNMIHVVLESTVTDLLGGTTTVKTGEIIVGSAKSYAAK